MDTTRRKVEGKILAKELEIQELEQNIAAARAEIKGMKEVLKIIPRELPSGMQQKQVLRSGSQAEKAYKVLKKSGKPLYIDEILVAMKKAINKKNKASTANILSQYARKDEIFSRPQPNTFGLLEWEDTHPSNERDETLSSEVT